MKIKYLLTISLAAFLSACTHPKDSVPIQSDSGYSDEYQYQNTPITNTPSLTNTEALAVGATGIVTGYAVGKYANKPRYSKPKASYSKPVSSYKKQSIRKPYSRSKRKQ